MESIIKNKKIEIFIENLRKLTPLSDVAVELFLSKTEYEFRRKGEILIRAERYEHYSYFILEGYARGFFFQDHKDITFWFAHSGMTLLSMNSYYNRTAGYENIELLIDCCLLKISNSDLLNLYHTNVELANLGRRLSDTFILYLEKSMMERNFMSASERYNALIDRNPEILQVAPLKHIASYLGISQVSLSRIRAGIQ
ncbi:MAG: Crp/Fnr family transcriptional regulator [Bacteroidales bacterium]